MAGNRNSVFTIEYHQVNLDQRQRVFNYKGKIRSNAKR